MSYRPKAFGLFCPTGCVWLPLLVISSSYDELPNRGTLSISIWRRPELIAYQAIVSRSPADAPVVPARAAYSHSASLGRRYSRPVIRDNLRQNSVALSHVTCSTGRLLPMNFAGFVPITARHCACVTSYFPM